ncbi:hypothetical protein MPER_04914 [Moniliophthora perniciosa FA553]|nr:hypothetical protein MPER_04914 [Moniliophthora perniciosa FA553]
MKCGVGIKAIVYLWLFLTAFLCTLVVLRVKDEDEMMKKQFGEEWEAWSRRVRYKLIPGVY